MSYTITSGAVTYTAYVVTADSFTDEYETAEILLLGRGRRVETGSRWGISGSLTVQIWDQIGESASAQRAALQALRAAGATCVLTNAFGTSYNVSLGDIQIDRMPGVGDREYATVTIPYKEVI